MLEKSKYNLYISTGLNEQGKTTPEPKRKELKDTWLLFFIHTTGDRKAETETSKTKTSKALLQPEGTTSILSHLYRVKTR